MKKDPGRGELILIVDDEQEIQDVSKMILEQSGYKVITTSTGEEALEAFMNYQESIELVIIDLMLPGIYGNELLDRMREVKSELKVIFSSGVEKNAESLLLTYSRQSAILLTKPYTSDKLLDKVTSLLNK